MKLKIGGIPCIILILLRGRVDDNALRKGD
jgi:hypothetical protein